MSKIPILMYHNIAPAPQGKRLSSLYTHPQVFARQMKLLSLLGYKGLSVKQLPPYLSGSKSGKVVGITFDDGYLDNLTNALPILKKHNFSATVYLVSGLIGKKNDWTRNQNVQESQLMDISQIKSWLSEGMSIGSHTHSHVHLGLIDSIKAQNEIRLSKEILENTFSTPVTDFCFPYGEYKQETLTLLKNSGFHTAVTTRRGRASQEDDLLCLPRVHMTKRTHTLLFLAKLLTSYEDAK